MHHCSNLGGTGEASCRAREGWRSAFTDGGAELCDGRVQLRGPRHDGIDRAPSPFGWRERVGPVGVTLLFVLIGWPALVFIDFALELLLAYVI